jgi:hypothetical protein
MTRVEELTEDMVFLVQGCDREFFEKYTTKLNEVISAAHAEGVAEGEERQLVRILEQSYLKDAFNNPLVTLPVDFYVVPKSALIPKDASVLAPKEKP